LKTQNSQEFEEFDKFNNTMRQLVSVPHSEIKTALDEEKAAKLKQEKRKTRKQSSASDHVDGETD